MDEPLIDSSSGFLYTITEYIAIVLIMYFLYTMGMFNSILQFFGLSKFLQVKESFQSLFSDDIEATANELVLRNKIDYPTYRLGTASKDTYPTQLGSFIRKRIYPVNYFITGGTMENIKMLMTGQIDMALVDEEVLLSVLANDNKIRKLADLPIDIDLKELITGIAVLYYQPFLLITAKDRNIATWDDIKDRRIGVPSKTSNSYYHYMKLLNITNLAGSVNTVIYDNQQQMFSDFLDNKLDAFYITTNQKNKGLLELSRNIKLRFISPISYYKKIIDTSSENPVALKDLIKKQFSLTIPKAIDLNYFYSNINTGSYLNTIASRMILVGRRDIPSEHIHYLLTNILKSLTKLQLNINGYLYDAKLNNVVGDAFQFDELASMTKELELHAGARQFYKEVGLVKIQDSKIVEKQKLGDV